MVVGAGMAAMAFAAPVRRRTVLAGAVALVAPRAWAQDADLVAAARRDGTVTWYNGYIGDTIVADKWRDALGG